MIAHRSVRPALRRYAGATVFSLALALPLLAAPAFADEPAAWRNEPHVTALDFLLVLVIIPGGIALLISLLVALPSMIRGGSDDSGEAWRGEGEWFGGPAKGIDAPASDKADDSGGASAHW